MALTRRQKEVLDFLDGFIKEHGYSPSYEEIASGLGLASLATVHKHVQALESKHYLKRNYNHSRSLEVTERYLHRRESAPSGGNCPSRAAARAHRRGFPVEAIPNRESCIFRIS